MKKILALVLAMLMVLAVGTAVFAADDEAEASTPSITIITTSDASEATVDTTVYTWYQILEASIAEDPTSSGATQSGGKVAYYVTTADRAAELTETDLFDVVRVGETDKWFVALKEDSTATAEDIAAAFAASTFDLSKFPTGTFHQTAVGGSATSVDIAAGYYYITSTAGTKAVIQTLTAVEIEEKNTFPTVDKAIKDEDKNAQIGDEIDYTLTVVVPATANDKIVVTDTMSTGLTFKEIKSVKADNADVAYTLDPEQVGDALSFKITFDAATVIANQGKTIEIEYIAILNGDAPIEEDIPNKIVLDYGEHYTTVEKIVKTKTYKFDFDKVDGDDKTKLTGAEFELQVDGTALALVEVEAGKTYRIATEKDAETTTKIVTNGNTVTVNGLDLDVTYTLFETKAPTGYNKLDEPFTVEVGETAFVKADVENNKGSVLPSTGGIGTTIFYVVGAVLVIGAVVVLVTRRRINAL